MIYFLFGNLHHIHILIRMGLFQIGSVIVACNDKAGQLRFSAQMHIALPFENFISISEWMQL